MSKTNLGLTNPEWSETAVGSFVVPEYIDAPYTAITNRAQILDESKTLKVLQPVERVLTLTLESSIETSDNGPVFTTEDNRIRFIGGGLVGGYSNSHGSRVYSATEAFIETTFYGTGLNILTWEGGPYNYFITVDEGVESGNIVSNTGISLLGGRNYKPNQIVNCCNSLELGWHTVLLRGNTLNCYGIEILNESSQLNFLDGIAFLGSKKFSLLDMPPQDFKTGITSNGGRKAWFVGKDGLEYAVTNVGTPAYLEAADHSSEEVVRKIHWREFGANRSDDFSTLASTQSDRAYTLDDGTTTLIGNDVIDADSIQMLGLNITNSSVTITFVGTGLDITRIDSGNGGSNITGFFVDGVSIGEVEELVSSSNERTLKVCSGLSYGTHIIKITRVNAVTYRHGMRDFIIYQPKKPVFEGLEIFDTNVLADFVMPVVTTVAQGVLNKAHMRETVYTGTWTTGLSVLYPSGFSTGCTGNGDFQQNIFTGMGLTLTFGANTNAGNCDLYIDGTLLTTANFPSVTIDDSLLPVGTSFNFTTGRFDCTPTVQTLGVSLGIVGLGFGLHTFKSIKIDGTYMYSFDISVITPIHINDPSFKIGSLSGLDKRQFTPQKETDLSKMPDNWQSAKALLYYNGVTNSILSSKNVAQVIDTYIGSNVIVFEKPFKNNNYIVIGTTERDGGNSSSFQILNQDSIAQKKPHSCYIETRVDGSVDDMKYMVAFFGELADE